MTLRKITFDKSVRYIPQSEQTQSISKERDSKSNTRRNSSLPRKQNKKHSQHNEKFVAEGFGLLKWIMNCYF